MYSYKWSWLTVVELSIQHTWLFLVSPGSSLNLAGNCSIGCGQRGECRHCQLVESRLDVLQCVSFIQALNRTWIRNIKFSHIVTFVNVICFCCFYFFLGSEFEVINLSTESLKWRPMLRQMRVSMLRQTLLVSVASNTRKIQSSNWLNWRALWHYVISRFCLTKHHFRRSDKRVVDVSIFFM